MTPVDEVIDCKFEPCQLNANYAVEVHTVTAISGWKRWVIQLRIGHNKAYALNFYLNLDLESQFSFTHTSCLKP